MYESIIAQQKKMLVNLNAWLDKAAAHAEQKSFDPELLLQLRLVPDMFPLSRQIQAACDAAKFSAARLAGVDAPKHEDNEKTLDELRTRIKAVVEYLDGFGAEQLAGGGERVIVLPFLPEGRALSGHNYLMEMALPNFYFHVTTAYAILRHNGIELGKRDYISSLSLQDAPAAAD